MAKTAKTGKTTKDGPQLTSLKAPSILELEKSVLNMVFCSNNKLKILFYKLFSIF